MKHPSPAIKELPVAPKRKAGRPPVSEEDRLIARNIRMTDTHWRKIDSAGGIEWLRQLVARARVRDK